MSVTPRVNWKRQSVCNIAVYYNLLDILCHVVHAAMGFILLTVTTFCYRLIGCTNENYIGNAGIHFGTAIALGIETIE